jgi:hypothetical protein
METNRKKKKKGPALFMVYFTVPFQMVLEKSGLKIWLHPQSGWPLVASSKGALDHQFAKIAKILPPP